MADDPLHGLTKAQARELLHDNLQFQSGERIRVMVPRATPLTFSTSMDAVSTKEVPVIEFRIVEQTRGNEKRRMFFVGDILIDTLNYRRH